MRWDAIIKVNTTRIYTMETGRQHMKLLERVSRVLLT